MLKALKWMGLGLAMAVAILLILAAGRPDTFAVSRHASSPHRRNGSIR